MALTGLSGLSVGKGKLVVQRVPAMMAATLLKPVKVSKYGVARFARVECQWKVCGVQRAVLFIGVCMVITFNSKMMDQPGMVANPARGELNRENEYFPVPVYSPHSDYKYLVLIYFI